MSYPFKVEISDNPLERLMVALELMPEENFMSILNFLVILKNLQILGYRKKRQSLTVS